MKYFTESSIIDRLIRLENSKERRGALGIGDDGAVLAPHTYKSKKIVCSTDSQTESVHFNSADNPASIAAQGLHAAVSDLYAMGAQPAWYLLSINAPRLPHAWFNRFINQLKKSQERYNIALIGGNTSRCKTLSFTYTVLGVARRIAERGGAKKGDTIFLGAPLGKTAYLRKYHNRIPKPAEWHYYTKNDLLAAQQSSSAIDISDGLVADLPKLLKDMGGEVWVDKIPIDYKLEKKLGINYKQLLFMSLNSGEDYVLCTTSQKSLKRYCYYPIGVVGGKSITYLYHGKPIKWIKSLKNKEYSHF